MPFSFFVQPRQCRQTCLYLHWRAKHLSSLLKTLRSRSRQRSVGLSTMQELEVAYGKRGMSGHESIWWNSLRQCLHLVVALDLPVKAAADCMPPVQAVVGLVTHADGVLHASAMHNASEVQHKVGGL